MDGEEKGAFEEEVRAALMAISGRAWRPPGEPPAPPLLTVRITVGPNDTQEKTRAAGAAVPHSGDDHPRAQ